MDFNTIYSVDLDKLLREHKSHTLAYKLFKFISNYVYERRIFPAFISASFGKGMLTDVVKDITIFLRNVYGNLHYNIIADYLYGIEPVKDVDKDEIADILYEVGWTD